MMRKGESSKRPFPFKEAPLRTNTTSSLSPWILSSKRYDPETTFTYYGFRYYSPEIGRWITPDPLGFTEGPNLYLYVRNNPFLYTDPYGLSVLDFFKGIGKGSIEVIGAQIIIGGVTAFCPPLGGAVALAYNGYCLYNLANTVYTLGSHFTNQTQSQGLVLGSKQVLQDFCNAFTHMSSEEAGSLAGALLSGKVAKRLPFGRPIPVQTAQKASLLEAELEKTTTIAKKTLPLTEFQVATREAASLTNSLASTPLLPYSYPIPAGNKKFGMKHILLRHKFTSKFKNVSRFLEGWDKKEICGILHQGFFMQEGMREYTVKGKKILETTLPIDIGFDKYGKITNRLRIVIYLSNTITSAYPIERIP